MYLYTCSDDGTYHYTYCYISFTISRGTHVRTHNEENPYKCRHCEKSISLKNHLKVHVISHITKNNYQCIYCDKPFLNNILIKDNHLLAHAGEKIY